jgi:ankyrin repeat protein
MVRIGEFLKACADDDYEFVKNHINAIDVNAQTADGNTFLLAATTNQHTYIVSLLLDHGADPNMCNVKIANVCPIYVASKLGNYEIVKILLDHGASPNAINSLQMTSLMTVTLDQNVPIAKLLLERGADPNMCIGTNKTCPLHVASRNGNIEIVKSLLDAGADINIADSQNITPLIAATINVRVDVVKLLLSYGAITTIIKRDGNVISVDNIVDAALENPVVQGNPELLQKFIMIRDLIKPVFEPSIFSLKARQTAGRKRRSYRKRKTRCRKSKRIRNRK